MKLEDLTDKEYVLLSRRAEERLTQVLESQSPAVDGDSNPDQRVNTNRERLQALHELDQQTDWPLVWHIDEGAIGRLLGDHLPSLYGADAGERIGQAQGEIFRFYGELSNLAGDPRCRSLFLELTEAAATGRAIG